MGCYHPIRWVLLEKQVLFRLEAELLERLDRKLAQKGYKTRNRWFREMVQEFIADGRSRKVAAGQDRDD